MIKQAQVIPRIEKKTKDAEIVSPGELLTSDLQFMRGHGTFVENQSLVASVVGRVERVNKLLSVKPLKTRFNGEIGDVVVGRITELGPKRWKVDISARQSAVLLLSSINLPGGIQRRKTESDEMEMRSFFNIGDLLSAEVQSFFADGAASIHTRNIKYGKLRNGQLVILPSALIKRLKSQFMTLSCGVDIVVGINGHVFIQLHRPMTPEMALQTTGDYSDTNDTITIEERQAIVRVAEVVKAVGAVGVILTLEVIEKVYAVSLEMGVDSKDIGNPGTRKVIIEKALQELDSQ